MKITMIAHSTVLIEAAGLRILTDPYFSQHGNPAYARVQVPARTREELANVDLVLISHNHFDHIDRKFLRMLPQDTRVFAPSSSAWMTRLKGGRNVTGLRPWQRIEIGGISITAVPARHVTFSRGYVIEADGRRSYFAGDTYLADFMARIGRELQPDVALIPVTTFRVPMTMGETQAVEAVRTLKPKLVIPIHLGLQPRSPLMRSGQTAEHFREFAHQAGLKVDIRVLSPGETWTLA